MSQRYDITIHEWLDQHWRWPSRDETRTDAAVALHAEAAKAGYKWARSSFVVAYLETYRKKAIAEKGTLLLLAPRKIGHQASESKTRRRKVHTAPKDPSPPTLKLEYSPVDDIIAIDTVIHILERLRSIMLTGFKV